MPFITQGKTNLRYLLIVVILAIIVGGGILGYYYFWIKDLEAKLAELELKIPQKIIKDETVNWKTYANPELGVSIKYPPGWFIYDNKTPPCVGDIPEYVFINETQFADYCIYSELWPADLYVYVDEEPFDPLPESTPYDTFTSLVIAGERGVINFRTEKSEGPRRIDTRIFVNHRGRGYQISYPNTDYQGTHDPIYDQIISTFRFLE